MIPTMILVGLVLGLIPQHWEHQGTATAALAVLTSLAFGLAVGEALAGTFLALVNVAVGLLVGFAVQKIGRAVLRLPAHRQNTRSR